MSAPSRSRDLLPEATRALLAVGERLASRLAFDALSVCVLDDSQDKLLVLPVTGEESRRGVLRKILDIGAPPFPWGIQERVLDRGDETGETASPGQPRPATGDGAQAPATEAAPGETAPQDPDREAPGSHLRTRRPSWTVAQRSSTKARKTLLSATTAAIPAWPM